MEKTKVLDMFMPKLTMPFSFKSVHKNKVLTNLVFTVKYNSLKHEPTEFN